MLVTLLAPNARASDRNFQRSEFRLGNNFISGLGDDVGSIVRLPAAGPFYSANKSRARDDTSMGGKGQKEVGPVDEALDLNAKQASGEGRKRVGLRCAIN